MGHVSYIVDADPEVSPVLGATPPDSCGGGLCRDRRRLVDPIRVNLICVVCRAVVQGRLGRKDQGVSFGRAVVLSGVSVPYYIAIVTPGALIRCDPIRAARANDDGVGHRFARAVQRQRRPLRHALRRAGSIEYRGQAQLDCLESWPVNGLFGDMA